MSVPVPWYHSTEKPRLRVRTVNGVRFWVCGPARTISRLPSDGDVGTHGGHTPWLAYEGWIAYRAQARRWAQDWAREALDAPTSAINRPVF